MRLLDGRPIEGVDAGELLQRILGDAPPPRVS
jgi:hypothetical protein